MGKNSQERRMAKMEQSQAEKQQIEERRQERLRPVYKATRQLVLTLIVTIALLYIGVLINHHLPSITSRLIGGEF